MTGIDTTIAECRMRGIIQRVLDRHMIKTCGLASEIARKVLK